MNITDEFTTVDLILNSSAETRAVDAFTLALIKTERQLRKLFTHLIYQFPCFAAGDVPALRKALATNNRVYFSGFIAGIDALFPVSVEQMVGSEYATLRNRIGEATAHRNKIFHGQLTLLELTREDLSALVFDIRNWCAALAAGASNEFGYDGFGRNSFQKSSISGLSHRYLCSLHGVDEYANFMRKHMTRKG